MKATLLRAVFFYALFFAIGCACHEARSRWLQPKQEVNMHEGTFVGIARNAVDKIVGPEACRGLTAIDHEHLTHGAHWKWLGGQQVFTPAGLEIIVEQLRERGFRGAALALQDEIKRRTIEAAPRPVPAITRSTVRPRATAAAVAVAAPVAANALDGPYARFHDADEDL